MEEKPKAGWRGYEAPGRCNSNSTGRRTDGADCRNYMTGGLIQLGNATFLNFLLPYCGAFAGPRIFGQPRASGGTLVAAQAGIPQCPIVNLQIYGNVNKIGQPHIRGVWK